MQRVIPLPSEVDRDNVAAKMKDGVLTGVPPKSATPAAKMKRIAINAAS
jgi:HSP20 family molecular chaperone IbpA